MNLKLYGYSKVLIKYLVFEFVFYNISGINIWCYEWFRIK